MKPTIVFLAATFLINIYSFGQNVKQPAPTTEDEYNYVTKGYEMQTSSGLDMKKGYHFTDMFERKQGNYLFTGKYLVRESANEVAAIMVIAKSDVSRKTYYICIPYNNEQLVSRYWADLSAWDKPITTAYTQVLTLYLGGLYMVFGTNELPGKKH